MLGIMIINNYYVLHRGVYVEMTTGSSVIVSPRYSTVVCGL